ncbi:MAG: ThuA domain-containing protein [Armatimonadetes bacterium]|nr:ThuA domain-containing protein [Armatimonadota bacterium]MDE2207029.1 ThuA domain-containing protein [Armatimonadota bacterium]
MTNAALVVWGGWSGHEPEQVAQILGSELKDSGFVVTITNTLDAYKELNAIPNLKLVVPIWTMGTIRGDQLEPLLEAVKGGIGIAGCHGGMCDSFRDATEYQFMTGGQWVAHPGNDQVEYTVRITDPNHFVTSGSTDFKVRSEQYYLHVDPAVKVQAVTRFPTVDGPHAPNGNVDMPVVWTKYYGQGRVFYCSLGHSAATVAQPEVLAIMKRGMIWAAGQDG